MDQDLTKFEQESTKTPIWLPIAGVAIFFVVVILAVTCPGRAPELGEEGQQTEQAGQ